MEAAQGLPAAYLSMLGYGNLVALVNDPRVEPRAWVQCNDVDSETAADDANCVVRTGLIGVWRLGWCCLGLGQGGKGV